MIVGVSPAIRRALALAERYARTPLPILLVGATGTGKELFVEHIHERSGRPGSLVDVNCGALPREMVESLLFGHRRGAFTGAVESREGYVTRADGGTLFLDEATSLTSEAQVKLLRVLETAKVEPLGDGRKRAINLRVVAAAQEELGAALREGRFRRDLYQRLAGVVIELPPLAARPEDIPVLAAHFAGMHAKELEAGAEYVLLKHSWPGNVRELRVVIERAAGLVANGTLPAVALAEAIDMGAVGESTNRTGNRRRAELLAVCERHQWSARRIAGALGIGRSTLFEWLKASGISLRYMKQSEKSADDLRMFRTVDPHANGW